MQIDWQVSGRCLVERMTKMLLPTQGGKDMISVVPRMADEADLGSVRAVKTSVPRQLIALGHVKMDRNLEVLNLVKQ